MDAPAPCNSICSLCGGSILANPVNPAESLSMDHVPPKQFYPKEMRASASPKLWCVPKHRRCNGQYREDEEYFYHASYPLMEKNNRELARVVYRDLMRRTKKPQTPAMARSLLKEFRRVSESGIVLPPGIVQFNLDLFRVQRVVIKIAQRLFFRDQQRYLPSSNCKDIQLCELETEVPELYQLTRGARVMSVLPDVFSYRRFEFENFHLLAMLFWNAFMSAARSRTLRQVVRQPNSASRARTASLFAPYLRPFVPVRR